VTVDNQQVRAVVVGVGAITSQGPTADDLWNEVSQGNPAIRPVRHIDMSGYRTAIAGEVQVERQARHDVGYPAGFRDRALDFALLAAEEAMTGCGQVLAQLPAERWGVVIGTCNAGLLSARHWYWARMLGETADPRLLLFVPPQAIAEAVAGAFGLRGPALSVNTACAAGANAIGYAADLIRAGQADAVISGGTDALSDVLIAGFNSLESLSPEPAAPYSRDRKGLSLGEGSGMFVLMRRDLAHQHGLTAIAEVAGLGLSADGYHPTAPHPEGTGASRAIQAALRAAGVSPADVGYVNSHGTGTAKNDPAETKAMKLGLGPAARSAAVSSTKSMIGHLLGAAGAVEGMVTVKALENQLAPPTANFTEPDPECDLDYVANAARPLRTEVAVSNNFAFGGANASVVFTRGRSAPPPEPGHEPVVITGVAALTPAGTTPAALWDAVAARRDCTTDEGGTRIGRVDLDADAFLSAKVRRRMDRLGVFSVVASKLALASAKLELDEENRGRVGAILGTGIGPMESMELFSRPLFEDGPRAANPAVFPNTVYNAAAGQVAMHVGAVGPTTTLTAGHAAGASAIIYAADVLARGQADAMLAIGADTLTAAVIDAYRAIGSVDPAGYALSEASVALLLERRAHADQRGALVLAEVLGYGIAGDGLGVGRWDRQGQGAERSMRLALEQAGLEPADIATVWSSQSGLKSADVAEQQALARIFGTGDRPVILAPRMFLGEPVGAGAPLSAALAAEGWIRSERPGPALVTSSSLGGTHFSIVLGQVAAPGSR
jgi:3-oxoacyl-[acyl-carrier-protein] synthase II